jgi:hypothetical protein
MTQIDEKNTFALLDVLRLLLLNQPMVAQLITKHHYVMDTLFTLCTNAVTANTKLMLLRCLCHISSNANGALYLSHANRLPVVIDFVTKALIKDTNVNLQLTASSILIHVRDYLTPCTAATKKLITCLIITLKTLSKADRTKDGATIDMISDKIGIVLYVMMRNDELVIDAVKEKDYESLRSLMRNGVLASAIIALVEAIDLDPAKILRDDLAKFFEN